MPCEVRKGRVGGRKSTKPGSRDRRLVCSDVRIVLFEDTCNNIARFDVCNCAP